MKARTIVLGGIAGFSLLCVAAIDQGIAAGDDESSADTEPHPVEPSVTAGPAPTTSDAPPTSSVVPAASTESTVTPAGPPTTAFTSPVTTVVVAVGDGQPSFDVVIDSGRLTINGVVFSDVERLALISAATAVVGEASVDASGLSVTPAESTIADRQVAGAVRLVFLVADGLRLDRLVVDGGLLVLAGAADDVDTYGWALAALDQAAADGMTIVDQLAAPEGSG